MSFSLSTITNRLFKKQARLPKEIRSDILKLQVNWFPELDKSIRQEQSRYVKLSNQRLRALEKKELDMYSYDRAKTYAENNFMGYFRSIKPSESNLADVYRNMEEMATFLNNPTSTITGARSKMNEKLQLIEDNTKITWRSEEQKRAFARLISDDPLSMLLEDVKGGSGETLEAIAETLQDAVEAGRIEEATRQIGQYIDSYNTGTRGSFTKPLDWFYSQVHQLPNEWRKPR